MNTFYVVLEQDDDGRWWQMSGEAGLEYPIIFDTEKAADEYATLRATNGATCVILQAVEKLVPGRPKRSHLFA